MRPAPRGAVAAVAAPLLSHLPHRSTITLWRHRFEGASTRIGAQAAALVWMLVATLASQCVYLVRLVCAHYVYLGRLVWAHRFIVATPFFVLSHHRSAAAVPLRFAHHAAIRLRVARLRYGSTVAMWVVTTLLALLLGWFVAKAA
jgi:hypothetical protein